MDIHKTYFFLFLEVKRKNTNESDDDGASSRACFR